MDDQNKIYRYLENAMSEAERIEFEHLLESNTQLRNTFEMEKAIIRGIEIYGRRDFKNRVGHVMKEYQRGKLFRRLIWGGAFLILLLLLGLFFANKSATNIPPNSNQIMATYLKSPELGGTVRSESSPGGELEVALRQSFQNGRFDQVVDLPLNSIDLTGEWDLTLMAGVSFLQEGMYQKAFDYLEQIPEDAIGYFDHAEWYGILALIGLEEHHEAIERLGSIVQSPDHDHYEEASQLYNDIR